MTAKIIHSRKRPQYTEYEIHARGCDCAPHGYSFSHPKDDTAEQITREIQQRDSTAFVMTGACLQSFAQAPKSLTRDRIRQLEEELCPCSTQL